MVIKVSYTISTTKVNHTTADKRSFEPQFIPTRFAYDADKVALFSEKIRD